DAQPARHHGRPHQQLEGERGARARRRVRRGRGRAGDRRGCGRAVRVTGGKGVTTVAAAVADLLADAGAQRCYTVPGESFLGLIDEVDRHPGLQLVSVRHESGAAFMADADARLTGVPAVAMASRGPGSSNLAIGVHTAYQDSTPMVVLLGQVDSQLRGREAFQEVDL